MAKHRPAWIDKSDVQGTENIGFYDCFEGDRGIKFQPRRMPRPTITLMEPLERAGYRVQVDMISLAIVDNLDTQRVRLACSIKEAGEVVQLDKLAFCLAHPALHRKLNFSLRLKHAGGSVDRSMCRSKECGNIYIDAADSTATAAWLDPVKAQEWVLAQLKAQGIVMRAA